MTAAKNAIVSWLLNFTIRMFVKSAVTQGSYEYTHVHILCAKTIRDSPFFKLKSPKNIQGLVTTITSLQPLASCTEIHCGTLIFKTSGKSVNRNKLSLVEA